MKNSPTGTYLLMLKLREEKSIDIGSLGSHILIPGFYTYTGSAMSGIFQRVTRYFKPITRSHWHIDRLIVEARLERILFLPSWERLECRINEKLQRATDPAIPVPGFGASDCRCPSHLFRYEEDPLDLLRKILRMGSLD